MTRSEPFDHYVFVGKKMVRVTPSRGTATEYFAVWRSCIADALLLARKEDGK